MPVGLIQILAQLYVNEYFSDTSHFTERIF